MPTSPFDNQRFIVLETFRRNGTSVITPLGFVQEGSVLYARTTADSWKVKRIRANPRVRVAPGTVDGIRSRLQRRPQPEWVHLRIDLPPQA